ncbi:hypothetical protein L2E82_30110 [Cichorium intybus]|uniref:Uncharacterized protein n=1 Tax=Cichorium intybus TaxID=13427 RepID=A0ACB9CZH2_CICIN|nr:hypothetical protein L2E82_30110 [Cichorium intybus]
MPAPPPNHQHQSILQDNRRKTPIPSYMITNRSHLCMIDRRITTSHVHRHRLMYHIQLSTPLKLMVRIAKSSTVFRQER